MIKKIYTYSVLLFVMIVAFFVYSVASANVVINNYTFQDTFNYQGKTFYLDVVQGVSSGLSNGTYLAGVKVGLYGETTDMEAHEADIEEDLEFKIKPTSGGEYVGNLDIVSIVSGMTSTGVSGYANSFSVESYSSESVDPGIYTVDVLINSGVVSSLSGLCLETFDPPVGNQSCGSGGSESSENSNTEQQGETSSSESEGEQEENETETEGSTNQGSEENSNEENSEIIFGGSIPFAHSTAIPNVPMIDWADQLMFRLVTEAYDVEVFGVNVTDLQNGTANIGDFIINMVDTVGQEQPPASSVFSNVSLSTIINGEFSIDDLNFPGVNIEEQQFFYDFYYSIRAALNLNGNSYDAVRVYVGKNERNLTGGLMIAEYLNASGGIVIDELVYNLRNDGNEFEQHAMRLNQNRDYYVGVYGINNDEEGNPVQQDTIAIKRLPIYSHDFDRIGFIDVNWDPSPHMDIISTTAKFDIAGNVETYNHTPADELELRFGFSDNTFKPIGKYVMLDTPDQILDFEKNFQNVYAYYSSSGTFETLPIQPNMMYYMGVYENDELISFQPAGRTPDYLNPEDNPNNATDTTGEEVQTDLGGMFNQNPFADLEQDLSSGIVPCDGLNIVCDYPQLINLVQRGINFVFIMIIPIAAIAFAYAGFLLLFQGSNPEKRKHARDVFIKVLIGIVIVLAAWLIVRTILTALGVDDANVLLELSN